MLDPSDETLPPSVTQSSSGSTPEVINAVVESSPRVTQPTNAVQPRLAVQVSPHHIPSSQVWEYLSYSSVPYSSIRDEGIDSGIVDLSPHLETQDIVQTEHDYIVPDSQSLNYKSPYAPSNSKEESGAGSHFDTVHTVPASSVVSNIPRTLNIESPAAGPVQSRIPRPTEVSSRSIPLSTELRRSQKSQNRHLAREVPIESDSRPSSDVSNRLGFKQSAARLSDSSNRFSNLDEVSSPGNIAQPNQRFNSISGNPVDSLHSPPAPTSLIPNHSNVRKLQASDLALEQDSRGGQRSKGVPVEPQNLHGRTNGHWEGSEHCRRNQDSEAIDSQNLDSHLLSQYSNPPGSSPPEHTSNRSFRSQELLPSSSNQALASTPKGKNRSSSFQTQTQIGLDNLFNFQKHATSSSQKDGRFASSLQIQNPIATISDTSSTSHAQSSSSKFQTQIPLKLDSPFSSSQRANRPSRSRHGSQPAVSVTTRDLLDTALNSGEAAQPSEQIPKLPDSSVLSQRDPNSQPEKLLHSAQEREEFCFPSIESAEEEFEKPSQSSAPSQTSWRIGSFSPARTMAENGQTAISSAVQMPAIHSSITPERSSVPFRERLRNMRADSAARLMANNADMSPTSMPRNMDMSKPNLAAVDDEASPPRVIHRSPSIIPKPVQLEPVGDSRLAIQTIEDPISAGSSQEIPLVPVPTPMTQPLAQLSQQDITQALKSPKVGEMEFVVPLPAPARVRDQYVAIINGYQEVIHAIVTEEETDPSVIEKGQEFLDNVENLSIHLDMVDSTTSTQQDVPPNAEALWASNCSFKFQFLQHLINYMRRDDMHIVIVAKEGRLMDLIEIFLKGLSAAYNRPDTMSSNSGSSGDNLRFSLITSKEGESTELLPAANLVIAFDSTFDATNSQVQEVRNHLLNVGQLAPVVHLMIYSSPEHISRCLPALSSDLERLRIMISCITFTREEFGSILPEENIPEANAEEVAEFIKAGAGSPWMIPSIRPIEIQGLEFDFQDTQQPAQNTKADPHSAKSKRALVRRPCSFSYTTWISSWNANKDLQEIENEGRATPKRMRMTPVPDQPDVTHISDSVPGTFAVSTCLFQLNFTESANL